MPAWHSLYLACAENNGADDIARTLNRSLVALGYELYDPFGRIPGKAYPVTVRLFIAPAKDGWTRILGASPPSDALLLDLSALGTCLSVTLNEARYQIDVFENGAKRTPTNALIPHLNPGYDRAALERILSGEDDATATHEHNGERKKPDLPLDVDLLPDDVQELARDLNPRQVNNMFNKLMNRFAGGLTPANAEHARGLLSNRGPKWDSSAGRQVRALAECLGIPAPYWYQPDFGTLRDAYQLRVHRQRTPNAPLHPGDDETMAAVPDALDYMPIYGGMTP